MGNTHTNERRRPYPPHQNPHSSRRHYRQNRPNHHPYQQRRQYGFFDNFPNRIFEQVFGEPFFDDDVNSFQNFEQPYNTFFDHRPPPNMHHTYQQQRYHNRHFPQHQFNFRPQRPTRRREERVESSKNAIKDLPQFRYTSERKNLLKNVDESIDCTTCAVCMDEFELGTYVLGLPCQHLFHVSCIKPWLEKNNTCPTCRFELPMDDRQAEKDRRRRMEEKFTKEGLAIIEFGMEVEKVFLNLSNLIEMWEMNANCNYKKLLSDLRKCDSTLTGILFKLDEIQINDQSIRNKRRNLIIRIQEIIKVVEKYMQRISDSEKNLKENQ